MPGSKTKKRKVLKKKKIKIKKPFLKKNIGNKSELKKSELNNVKPIFKRVIIVYTDGSCSNNGKINSFGGIGIYFPNRELKNVSKIFRDKICTNQKTELCAILTAIRYIISNLNMEKVSIIIKTDSEYSINCVTKWVVGWIKNGWRTKNNTPVANKEYIQEIHKYLQKYNIILEHVMAHTQGTDEDSIGNAYADRLATDATRKAYLQSKQLQVSGQYANLPTMTQLPTHGGNYVVELVKK